MAYLINDDLIWIATPKCASVSIEDALLNSNLKLKKYNELFTKELHIHPPLNSCLIQFGLKESVSITRDWFTKWLSSLNFIWDMIEFKTEYTPICKWEDLNNKTIYNIFNDEFVNKLYSMDDNNYLECYLKLLKNNTESIPSGIYGTVATIVPERFWKSNQKCTYEFDIKEVDKFTNFIENRFGEKLIIENKNISTKRPNKIIVNEELKSFVWEKFEKPFEKRNQLI
jgi:hypothetical protein